MSDLISLWQVSSRNPDEFVGLSKRLDDFQANQPESTNKSSQNNVS